MNVKKKLLVNEGAEQATNMTKSDNVPIVAREGGEGLVGDCNQCNQGAARSSH